MADCLHVKNHPKLPGSLSKNLYICMAYVFPNLRMFFKGIEIHGKLCTSKESPT